LGSPIIEGCVAVSAAAASIFVITSIRGQDHVDGHLSANPVARDSVDRYIRALKTTCLRAAAHGAAVVPNRRRRAAALNASAARSTANRADGAGRLMQSVGLNL